jgi:hypothetical protein
VDLVLVGEAVAKRGSLDVLCHVLTPKMSLKWYMAQCLLLSAASSTMHFLSFEMCFIIVLMCLISAAVSKRKKTKNCRFYPRPNCLRTTFLT